MAYPLMVMLDDNSSLSLESLDERLKEKFSPDPYVDIRLAHGKFENLILRWGDWSFVLSYVDAPHVIIESKEVADYFGANRPDRSEIAACNRRLEMFGDDDPNMEHFNDYLFIMEVLESYPGVYLFDPQQGEFVSATE